MLDAIDKARVAPLYVNRRVENAKEIIAWAKNQGFKTALPPDDLHVTVVFSRQPVDWMKTGDNWNGDEKGRITIRPGGARLVEKLGDKGAVVLMFSSSELSWRHEQIAREAGASWDWPQYQPHITLTYDAGDVDLDAVEPYRGEIVLGPEIFEELDDDWSSKIIEKVWREEDHPRHPEGVTEGGRFRPKDDAAAPARKPENPTEIETTGAAEMIVRHLKDNNIDAGIESSKLSDSKYVYATIGDETVKIRISNHDAKPWHGAGDIEVGTHMTAGSSHPLDAVAEIIRRAGKNPNDATSAAIASLASHRSELAQIEQAIEERSRAIQSARRDDDQDVAAKFPRQWAEAEAMAVSNRREAKRLLRREFERSKEAPDMKVEKIIKTDDEQRVAYGWASVISEKGVPHVDTQGDVIDADELVKATTELMKESRLALAMHQRNDAGEIDEAHRRGTIVHSFPLTAELAKSLGIQSDREGWIVGVHIADDEVWKAVKSGDLGAFSIGAFAQRVPLV